jgi:very-short-patch-repair endonuclease
MLQLCLDHRLPRPQVNAYRNGRELDFRWPAALLVVETNGWNTHRTRRAFEEDRARDRRLAVEGWRVIRITHRQLRDEPDAIAADVRTLLRAVAGGLCPPSGQSPPRGA